jgi:hypothetical protein
MKKLLFLVILGLFILLFPNSGSAQTPAVQGHWIDCQDSNGFKAQCFIPDVAVRVTTECCRQTVEIVPLAGQSVPVHTNETQQWNDNSSNNSQVNTEQNGQEVYNTQTRKSVRQSWNVGIGGYYTPYYGPLRLPVPLPFGSYSGTVEQETITVRTNAPQWTPQVNVSRGYYYPF